MTLELGQFSSPLGEISIALTAKGLCALEFGPEGPLQARLGKLRPGMEPRPLRAGSAVVDQLRAYFEGAVDALDDIPVDLTGTPFQLQVWAALRQIPVGTTMSYRSLAEWIGRRAAIRAVGTANARNPVALVVPCHRVIAADGGLSGYAFGAARKHWLLRHEGVSLAVPSAAVEAIAG